MTPKYVKFNPDHPLVQELIAALKSNTRAVAKLTKRLNEQAWNTDAVSVTSLPERWGEDEEGLTRRRVNGCTRR